MMIFTWGRAITNDHETVLYLVQCRMVVLWCSF